jgi:Tol biopolymer transport system component
MEKRKSPVPWILAGVWTGLVAVGIGAVAATPDDFGLNGVIIVFLVVVWAVGLALGAGARALTRRLRTPPLSGARPESAQDVPRRTGRALQRIMQLALGLVAAALFAGLVYASSGADRSAPLAGLRWTDETPAWSPTGKEIVFGSNRAAPKSSIDHLYLANADGTNVRRLTHDRLDAREPSFSPEGTRIVYAARVLDASNYYTEHGAIDLIAVDGTHRRSLTSGLHGDAGFPTWSPDGRWIAFIDTVSTEYGSSSRSDLYIVRPNGISRHRLAINVDDWSRPLAWSPDSREIAVVGANEQLYRITVDAEKPVRVTGSRWGSATTTDVAWSPDGREIAYVRGRIVVNNCFCDDDGSDVTDRHLWILDLKTGARRRLRALVDSGSLGDFETTVTWLPGRTPRLAAFDGCRTLVLSANGRKIGAIETPNGGALATGSASPSGGRLLFVDGPDNSYRSAIFVATARNDRVRPLTQRRHP